jgi:hypothetical protein
MAHSVWVLFASGIALAVNFALLGLADRLGIVTARGGFQRLVKIWMGPVLKGAGVERVWSALSLPEPSSKLFQVSFKVGVGLVMALIYVWIQPYLPGARISRGLIYALVIWLINAGIVLPALGEGFAGARSLSATGMTAFAIAHTSFFIVLAFLV